jgi:hypothetical protein
MEVGQLAGTLRGAPIGRSLGSVEASSARPFFPLPLSESRGAGRAAIGVRGAPMAPARSPKCGSEVADLRVFYRRAPPSAALGTVTGSSAFSPACVGVPGGRRPRRGVRGAPRTRDRSPACGSEGADLQAFYPGTVRRGFGHRHRVLCLGAHRMSSYPKGRPVSCPRSIGV